MNIFSVNMWLKKYAVVIVLLVSVFIYINTFNNGFVYDDAFFSDRTEIRTASYLLQSFIESLNINNLYAGTYRPVLVNTLTLNYMFFGTSAVGFHITNVLLHAITAAVVFLLAKRLFSRHLFAFCAGILFAVHPVHVEAVANIKSRDEILFALSAAQGILILLTIKKNAKNTLRLFLIGLCFFIGLFSKEMAITMPLLYVFIAYVNKIKKKYQLILIAEYGLVLILYTGLRFIALQYNILGKYEGLHPANFLYEADIVSRVLTSFSIYAEYIRLLVFPLKLRVTYGFAELPILHLDSPIIQYMPGFILLCSTVIFCVYSIVKQYKVLSIILVGWITSYVIISQIFFPKGDIIAERWMYTPSIFFILFVCYAGSQVKKWSTFIGILLLVIGMFFGMRTIVRNTVWKSNETLFRSMVNDSPKSVIAHTVYAQEVLKKNDILLAKKHAQIAEDIYADFPQIQNLLGNIALLERKYDVALSRYQKSLQISPDTLDTQVLLGSYYYTIGKYNEAEEYFRKVYENTVAKRFEYMISYAAVLAKQKKYSMSLSILYSLPSDQQERTQARFLFAVNYYKLQNKNKFLEFYNWNPSLSEEEKNKLLISF